MAGRISRGWSLMKQSWSVLRLDKELMMFPVFSSIACVLVMASFVAPIVLLPDVRNDLLDAARNQRHNPIWQNVTLYAVLFGYYFVNYFVVVFFNTALVSCAVIRFSGGDPTVGDGFRAAFARLPQIIAWTLLAATVGLILKIIEDRFKLIGRIVAGIIGLAWTVVTYLVVPTLAVERCGPFRAVSRSAELLKKTWGEALVGEFSMGAVNFLLGLPILLLILASVAVGVMAQSIWLALIPAVLAILYAVGLAIVTSTLQQIFLAGVYLYAARGTVPAGFSEQTMRSAFRTKE